MLEAAGCSTRNGQQTLEVLLRTLAILELHKGELRTQDKTYIDNPHRHGSEVSRYSIRCKRDWVFPRISFKIWLMRQSDDPALDAMLNKPRRCVALHRDDDEFVITFQPEDSIAFRSHDAKALRKVCAFLRWKIVSDTSLTADDLA